MASDAQNLNRNLISMQRIDPCAVKILEKTPHSALYKFVNASQTWEKTGVEGTFFIYQRADKPYYSIMIVNKQSLSDFIEPIKATMDLQLNHKLILMRKDGGAITCLWFYDEAETTRVHKKIAELINSLKANIIPPAEFEDLSVEKQSPVPQIPRSDSNQLLKLLTAAQSTKNSGKDVPRNNDEPSIAAHSSRKIECLSTSEPITRSPQGNSTSPSAVTAPELPLLLQKLMVQEQPKLLNEPEPVMINANDLEKDLQKTANRKISGFKEFMNSSSAISLAAFSTRSIRGSDGEAEAEVESIVSNRATGEDVSFNVGGSGNDSPILNKCQFVMALNHLITNDDDFVSKLHQSYADAMNQRFSGQK